MKQRRKSISSQSTMRWRLCCRLLPVLATSLVLVYVNLKSTLPRITYMHIVKDGIKHYFRNNDEIGRHTQNTTDDYLHTGFLLDSVNCKIPDIDAFDPKARHLVVRNAPMVCSGKTSITYVDGPFVRINHTAIKEVYNGNFKHCKYQPVFRPRPRDSSFKYGKESKPFFKDFKVSPKNAYIKVDCFNNNSKQISTNFHAVITEIPKVEARCRGRYAKHKKTRKPKEIFNVHLIGIDSVSRLNFIRNMPSTRRFLLNELNAFEMTGYNKVEDNTFVNIVPLTTGKFVSELGWNETLWKQEFDIYSFIWKNFSSAGYRTFYAEDAPSITMFNYLKEGFHKPPAEYYTRPLSLAMEMRTNAWNNDHHCIVDRQETTFYLDHLLDFVKTFEHRPSFSFSFLSRLTHDDQTKLSYADGPFFDFFKNLQAGGYLNNSVILFFSDHGPRFGSWRETYTGKVEERLPFNYLIFPKWFPEKYPSFADNLRINSKRLTTPFDMYETLKELLFFDGVLRKGTLRDRGISLFREIPSERRCDHAGILPHWCLCLEETDVPKESDLSIKVASRLVAKINEILAPEAHVCAKLSLESVSKVTKIASNEKILRFHHSQNDVLNKTVYYGKRAEGPEMFQVTLATSPGGALFEATLTFDRVHNNITLEGQISRINAYGNKSECVKNYLLKKYCFCKTND